MSDVITKRSEEFKELTDWMVQTTREIETAMKHLRPTIGQEHYLTGDEICRRFHVCKRTLQTLRDTKAIPYTTVSYTHLRAAAWSLHPFCTSPTNPWRSKIW